MPPVKRSVAGIVLDGEKIFIALRKGGGDLGGKWEFPGGKVEPGESDEQALMREYREEFNLEISTGEMLAEASFSHRGSPFTLFAYRIFFPDGAPEKLRLAEHSRWQWASLGEIASLDFAGSDLALLPALETYLETQRGVKQ
jgi:8-oxo-dGTP diphosphatase